MRGDIEKVFLQIRIQESERAVLRFHWVKNSDPSVIEINRFPRLVFSLTQSPFILEGTLKEHFQYYINEYPTLIEAISEDMYVDNLVSGRNKNPLSYFEKADLICISDAQIYRHHNPLIQSLKLNFLMPKRNLKTADLIKILGVPWDKNRDNLSIVILEFNEKLITKRKVLSCITSICNPLGLISASHIIGKVIYLELCDKKLPWDTEIPLILKKKFKKMGKRYCQHSN